jgi:hypothetical protein
MLVALVASGCGRPQGRTVRLPVNVQVTEPEGRGLAGVPILVGSDPLARTGRDGTVHTELVGPEGAKLTLSASCPANHRLESPPLPLVLREYQNLDGKSGISVALVCGRMLKTVAVALRASLMTRVGNGVPGPAGPLAGMPVLVDGRRVAVTDDNGVAHVSMKVMAGAKLDFVLGTDEPRFAALKPQNPSHKVVVQDSDHLVGVDQSFLEELRPRPRRPPHRITVLRGRQGDVQLGDR